MFFFLGRAKQYFMICFEFRGSGGRSEKFFSVFADFF